jgi:hypothetical protein
MVLLKRTSGMQVLRSRNFKLSIDLLDCCYLLRRCKAITYLMYQVSAINLLFESHRLQLASITQFQSIKRVEMYLSGCTLCRLGKILKVTVGCRITVTSEIGFSSKINVFKLKLSLLDIVVLL